MTRVFFIAGPFAIATIILGVVIRLHEDYVSLQARMREVR